MICPECGGRGEVLDAPGRVLDGRAEWVPCPMCGNGTALAQAREAGRAEQRADWERATGTCAICGKGVNAIGRLMLNKDGDDRVWHSWCYYRDQIKRAEAAVARLRAVIEQVEWINGCCPWCGGIEPVRFDRTFRTGISTRGHAYDCPRQQALTEGQ